MSAAGADAGAGLDLPGREVLVLGAGVSGPGAVRILRLLGARVTVADDRPAALERLQQSAESVTTCDVAAAVDRITAGGPAADAGVDRAVDLVVTSPGWRPDSAPLRAAAEAGIPVWGDVELAWRADRAGIAGPPRRWLAVTGTNGKTTTTGMLESIGRAAGWSVRACGNIGTPVTDVVLEEPRVDVLACELSSFQLHWAPSVRPLAGVVLNIAEDHLDWHGSLEAYAAAKAGVLTGDVAVAGVDDERAAASLAASPAPRRVGVRIGEPAPGELGVVDGMLVDRAFGDLPDLEPAGDVELIPADEVRPAGPAGILDGLAAAALARAAGAGAEAVVAGLRGYEVAAHRAALVAEVGGVRYVDDSKATNPHAARTSLLAGGPVVWIAGGLLKGARVDDLVAEVAPRLAGVVLLGRDRAELAQALRRHAPTVPVVELTAGDDATDPGERVPERSRAWMDEAVAAAAALAAPGDTVLLAPAAASMDMFTDYGHRGDCFAAAVRARAGE